MTSEHFRIWLNGFQNSFRRRRIIAFLSSFYSRNWTGSAAPAKRAPNFWLHDCTASVGKNNRTLFKS
jgi:hypothetical protein